MELGWSLPKRKKHLADLIKGDSEKTYPVPFQGEKPFMKVYRVPLGLPRYRLENGRTTGAQMEYLAKHPDLSDDYFRVDGESEAAQKAQHTILARLARERKNLFREFETAKQEEPIIISSVGYVINGNRRLCTWRSLYDADPKKYERFATVDAVVLPVCDEKDHDRLESKLQLEEDLKAEYIWTSHAIMLREKMQRYGYKEDDIAAIYDLSKKELAELLDALDYADEYLESRGAPKMYSAVDDKKYAFSQIVKHRKKAKSPEKRDLFTRAAFCLADGAAEGTRTYAEIQKVADHLTDVADDLVDEFELDVTNKSADEVAADLTQIIETEDNFERAREAIQEAINAAAARKREKKKELYVSGSVQQARESLQNAKDAIDDNASKRGVTTALDEIEVLVGELRTWAEGNG